MERDFHLDCYACQDCGIQLSDETNKRCYPLDDCLLCLSCHLSRLNNYNRRLIYNNEKDHDQFYAANSSSSESNVKQQLNELDKQKLNEKPFTAPQYIPPPAYTEKSNYNNFNSTDFKSNNTTSNFKNESNYQQNVPQSAQSLALRFNKTSSSSSNKNFN